ncbi:hypothetical protein [Paenibacillus alkalitolerans]|uniref:hypothetical protein n=1 Tax=Paenibacillus alkalitolerans TaxID=2799335 RepID=UPI0018F4B284|nr:hypothetical protein [Paenibacillus alkalitolerans]
MVRDLEKDLEICEAATPGPYVIESCQCGHPACNLVFIQKIRHSDGRLSPEDAQFIAEAHTGWPYAIQRAIDAEKEIDRLRNELEILQEQLQQNRCRD